LSGGNPGPHKLQVLRAGFVPDILDTTIYDGVVRISNDAATNVARQVATSDGILGGISSGAAIAAARQVAAEIGQGKKVLASLPGNGHRYLSTSLYQFDHEDE